MEGVQLNAAARREFAGPAEIEIDRALGHQAGVGGGSAETRAETLENRREALAVGDVEIDFVGVAVAPDGRALEIGGLHIPQLIADDARVEDEILRLAQMAPVIGEAADEIDVLGRMKGVLDSDRICVFLRVDDRLGETDDVCDASGRFIGDIDAVIFLPGGVLVEAIVAGDLQRVDLAEIMPDLYIGP